MATDIQIATLRRITNEPTTDTYSDEMLGDMIDVNNDVYHAASQIWLEKMAKVMAFDFAADGGDFKRSQLYNQYKLQYEFCVSQVKSIILKSKLTLPPVTYETILEN